MAKLRKIAVLLLVLVMILSVGTCSSLASVDPAEAENAAQNLFNMNLFQGVGQDAYGNPNFDLNRQPTRLEAVTMLVRLLGKESEAKALPYTAPFTDVDAWAKPYVNYAYQNGLVNGTSATTYGSSDKVTPSQYLTFILRSLGYSSSTDFAWDRAWELSDKIGITSGQYDKNSYFSRGDVAIISNNALYASCKDSYISLKDKNGIAAPTVTVAPVETYEQVATPEPEVVPTPTVKSEPTVTPVTTNSEVYQTPSKNTIKAQSTNNSSVTLTYILNTNTHKFHYPDCRSVKQMKDKNKKEYSGTREEIIQMGYDPCQNCNP